MSRYNPAFSAARRSLRIRPLVACLALSLGSAGGQASDAGTLPVATRDHGQAHPHGVAPAATLGVTHVVTSCDDPAVPPTCGGGDDGTLRKAYFCSGNNDTIDLTALTCSVISLSGTLTDAGASYLTLRGPGRDRLRIDAGGKGRAFVHNGNGALTLVDLSISGGALNNPYDYGGGGCIYSYGNVTLESSSVASCALSTHGTLVARGGAIFAKGRVMLFTSTVSGNSVYSEQGSSEGGAIYASSVSLDSSTISGNSAVTGHGRGGYGAGIGATGHVSVAYSTISGNSASGQGGGIESDALTMFESTVSGNDAFAFGGVYARTSAHIYNSTLVKNRSRQNSGGLYVFSAAGIRLESSIVALNTADGAPYDLGSDVSGPIAGANNIVIVASGAAVPADTISVDPKLGPLQDNGGPTQTHALQTGSPAIDAGNNVPNSTSDQRFFKRVSGPRIDIGAIEFVDSIFANSFDPGGIAI